VNRFSIIAIAVACVALTACADDDSDVSNNGAGNNAAGNNGGAGNNGEVEYVPLSEQDDPDARQPQRAGRYYPDEPAEMHGKVRQLLAAVQNPGAPRSAAGILVPHASLKASGFIAAEVYARVEIPDHVILIAPNHPGVGEPVAIWQGGPWYAPGVTFQYRNDLAMRLVELLEGDISVDREAFEAERSHPPEMQLPFLAELNRDVHLVSVLYYDNSDVFFRNFDIDRIEAHGKAIAALVMEMEARGESVLVLATTDLVHHVPVSQARDQDPRVMEHVVDLDLQGMYDYINEDQVSTCGEIPTGVFMVAMRELGYTEADLIALGNSFTTFGNADDVVGYPGVAVWK
jgi:MEMO1 family protein